MVSGPQSGALPEIIRLILTIGAISGMISFPALLWPAVQEVRGGLIIALYGGLMWLAIRADRDDPALLFAWQTLRPGGDMFPAPRARHRRLRHNRT